MAHDTAYQKSYQDRMEQLKKQYAEETSKEISDSTRKRNEIAGERKFTFLWAVTISKNASKWEEA